jgi:tetratricopeptide (TPR) repeat protein
LHDSITRPSSRSQEIHLKHHIVASGTLQWLKNLVSSLQETRRLLSKAGGDLSLEWISVTVVCLIAALPYLASLSGELVWDDRALIVEDPRFHEPDALRQLLMEDFFGNTVEPFRYGYLRPLTSLSYYLTWRVFGPDPLPFRLTNLALHVTVCVLVFVLARRLFPGDYWAAFLAAVIFAVHPVHVESVAWVAGRTDVLSTAFLLPVLLLMRPGAVSPTPGEYVTAALACGLALAAKEVALALPLAMVVFIAFIPTRGTRRKWLIAGGVISAGCLPYLLFRFFVTEVGVRDVLWSVPLAVTILCTFCATFAQYLGHLVWPTMATPYIQNPWRESFVDPLVLVGAVIIVGLLGIAWRIRRKHLELSWIPVLFLVSFAPVANVVRITGPDDMGAPMAQRFLYLPSLPWCVLVGFTASWLLRRLRAGPIKTCVICACVLAVGLYSIQTFRFTAVWSSEKTLFTTMVDQAPTAPLPRTLLGTWYHRDGQFGLAIPELEAALEFLPEQRAGERWASHNNLAGAWLALGYCDRALEHLEFATAAGYPFASLRHNEGLYHLACGSMRDAERCFRQAVELQDWHVSAHHQLALLLLDTNRPAEAVHHLEKALSRQDRRVDLVVALADAVGRTGREEEARRLLLEASELDRGNPTVEIPLGMLCLAHEKPDLALQAFERVMTRDPRNIEALHGSAIVAARRREFEAARRLLQRAIEVDPRYVDTLLTMAQIESELGNVELAHALVERAAVEAPSHPRVASTIQALARQQKEQTSDSSQ